MSEPTPSLPGVPDTSGVRETILDVFEESLQSQLAAIRRLRRRAGEPGTAAPTPATGGKRRRRKSRSQVDYAYDILAEAAAPLHISALLAGIQARFGLAIDRESLVSSLSKRVARQDRFTRPARNTFALLP